MGWREDGAKQQTAAIDRWKRKIREKGDRWWRKVESFTNDGDYQPSDHGEEPARA